MSAKYQFSIIRSGSTTSTTTDCTYFRKRSRISRASAEDDSLRLSRSVMRITLAQPRATSELICLTELDARSSTETLCPRGPVAFVTRSVGYRDFKEVKSPGPSAITPTRLRPSPMRYTSKCALEPQVAETHRAG